MKVTIRETDDLDAVKALDALCFPSDYREDFADQWMWLATIDDEPVGFSCYKVVGDEAHITRMGVIPLARGMGIQRRLAITAVVAARRAGLRLLETYVRADNIPSLRSLLNAGLEPTKAEPADSGHWFITLKKVLA